MHRLTNAQLHDMLSMQNTLNRKVNPDWLTANYAWHRAIRVECAELSDHLGWKWWKKQEPNWPQAHIELVDIWHFMLSQVLEMTGGNYDQAVSEINISLTFPANEVMDILGKKFTLGNLTLHQKVDVLSAFASVGHVFVALFERIMIDTGLTWAELRRIYVAKNVLNTFRQSRGYKEGVYIKHWRGEEDNVVLERLMNQAPTATGEQLLVALDDIYRTVVKEAA